MRNGWNTWKERNKRSEKYTVGSMPGGSTPSSGEKWRQTRIGTTATKSKTASSWNAWKNGAQTQYEKTVTKPTAERRKQQYPTAASYSTPAQTNARQRKEAAVQTAQHPDVAAKPPKTQYEKTVTKPTAERGKQQYPTAASYPTPAQTNARQRKQTALHTAQTAEGGMNPKQSKVSSATQGKSWETMAPLAAQFPQRNFFMPKQNIALTNRLAEISKDDPKARKLFLDNLNQVRSYLQNTRKPKVVYEEYMDALAQDQPSQIIGRLEDELVYGAGYWGEEIPHMEPKDYFSKIDAAMEAQDYTTARNWVQLMVGSDFDSKDRTEIAEYLDTLGDYDDPMLQKNWPAAETIVDYYNDYGERDPGQITAFLQTDTGKSYMRQVQDLFGILPPEDVSSVDDVKQYMNQLYQALEGKTGKISPKQYAAYMDLHDPRDQLMQNANMAFNERSLEAIAAAREAGGADSARMNSYIQAQKAYTTVAQIQNYLLTDENGWNEVDSEKLNDPTMTYLLGLMKDYGFPLGELTEKNYTNVINTATEHISRQAMKYRNALEKSGYDMNDVQIYLENLQHSEMEKGNIAALQAAGVLDEDGMPVQEVPWYDTLAYGAAGSGTNVIMDPVVGGINLINTGAAALSGKGDPTDPENYQPMRHGTVYESPSAQWHEYASKDLGEKGKMVYGAATSILQILLRTVILKKIGSNMNTFKDAFVSNSSKLHMMLNAAGNKSYQYIQSGATPLQAFTGGVIAGLIEAGTEKYSLERLMGIFKEGAQSGILRTLVKQGTFEYSEEFMSQGLNILTDVMILGDLSRTKQNIYRLMENGTSYKDATNAELMNIAWEMDEAGTQGMLSAVFGASIGSAVNAYQINRTASSMGTAFANQAMDIKGEDVYDLYAESAGVKKTDSDTIAKRKFAQWAAGVYKQWLKNGVNQGAENISDREYQHSNEDAEIQNEETTGQADANHADIDQTHNIIDQFDESRSLFDSLTEHNLQPVSGLYSQQYQAEITQEALNRLARDLSDKHRATTDYSAANVRNTSQPISRSNDSQSFSREYTRHPQRLHDQQARESQLQALETKKRQLQEISDHISKLPERKTRQQRVWLEQVQAELQREIDSSKAKMNESARNWTARKEVDLRNDAYISGFVDKKHKIEYNLYADKAQYDAYKACLGDEFTKTFVEFQRLKYDSPTGYKDLVGYYHYKINNPDSNRKYYNANNAAEAMRAIGAIKTKGTITVAPKNRSIIGINMHAAKRMAERGITQEMAQQIIDNADFAIKQRGGTQYAYYTKDGFAVLDSNGVLGTTGPLDERGKKLYNEVIKYVKDNK